MKLVIVDTPAQAKHVADALDESWQVEPCLGGVRDLPADKLGIDMLHDFQPSYALLPRKGNLVRRLMRAISNAEATYVATPPGRKGETMAWHILALAPTLKDKPVYRTPLTALTPEAIRSAFASPRELNLNWVDAEISRRMVDQLIRFLVSPLANQALNTNMTVSRAALVCLGILVAHEGKVQAFQPETGWAVKAHFVVDSTEFEANLYSTQGKALKFKTREQADSLAALLINATIWVDRAGSRITNLDAPRPYTAITLIAEAEARLGIEPAKTLELVQTLYEAGWLMYPTDETSALSPQAMEVTQGFIRKAFGHEYAASPALPADGLIQSAYLYPSEIDRLPEQLPGDGAALYSLIWHRFVASLMSAAQARQTAARLLVGTSPSKPFPLEFRAQAQQILFEGWRRAAPNEADAETAVIFPNLADGIPVTLKAVQIEEALPAPLPRMTPSTLMTVLDVQDMDRSAEYVAAIQILLESGNAELVEGRLRPTEQGSALAAFIEAHFGMTFSANQSVELEHAFEQVAAGEVKRLDLLRAFWTHLAAREQFGSGHPEP